MNLQTNKTFGHILAFLTILVWGATFIASKILLEVLTPLQLMLIRFLIGYVVLFIMKPKFTILKASEEFGFLLLGVFGNSLYYFFESKALLYTLTSNVSIIVSAAPILTAILAHFFIKNEKLNRNIFLGFFIAFLGVALVVFNGRIVLKLNPLGDILSLLAAFSWAIYSVVLKQYIDRIGSILLARKTMFYGFLTAVPFLILERKPIHWEQLLTPSSLISLAFLGLLGSGICYVTWNMAIKSLGVVITNNYIYLNPFITMVTATLILKENISIMGAFGAILIVAGVFISSYKKNLILVENS